MTGGYKIGFFTGPQNLFVVLSDSRDSLLRNIDPLFAL